MFVSTTRGQRLRAGLLWSVCLSVAVIGCGSAAHETSPHPPPSEIGAEPSSAPSDPGAIPVVHRADSLQRSHFALLRGTPEGLPLRIARTLPPGGGVGANWRLAQRLPTLIPAAWVVPGRGYLCMIESPPEGSVGFSCTPTGYVLKRGTYSATVPPHDQPRPRRRVIVGLAPDGVRKVLIHTAGSPPRSSRVTQNSFALEDESTRPPEFVELVRSG